MDEQMNIRLIKQLWLALGLTLGLVSCGIGGGGVHLSGTGEDFQRADFLSLLTDGTPIDTLAKEMNGNIKPHATDVMPKSGIAYIEPETGDRFTLSLIEESDSVGYGYSEYIGSGDWIAESETKITPRGKGFFVLDEVTGRGWDHHPGLLYVYEGSDSISVYDGVTLRTFVSQDILDERLGISEMRSKIASYALSGQNKAEAHSQWVKDGDTFMYIDASGSVMRNCWTHDGFYADCNGHWDPYTPGLSTNLMPDDNHDYVIGNWGSGKGKKITFKTSKDKDGNVSGTAVLSILVKDKEVTENYTVTPLGGSAYCLTKTNDPSVCCQVTIVEERVKPGFGHSLIMCADGKREATAGY